MCFCVKYTCQARLEEAHLLHDELELDEERRRPLPVLNLYVHVLLSNVHIHCLESLRHLQPFQHQLGVHEKLNNDGPVRQNVDQIVGDGPVGSLGPNGVLAVDRRVIHARRLGVAQQQDSSEERTEQPLLRSRKRAHHRGDVHRDVRSSQIHAAA